VGAGRASVAAARITRWDPLTIALAGVILQYVWRVQEVFPVLRYVQFTAVVSGAAVFLFMTDHDPARRMGRLRHPLFRLVLVIAVWAILSVPTSLHQSASVGFLTGNFLKTVVLVGVLAVAIRDRGDVERLLRLFVLGGVFYVVTAIVFAPAGGGRLGGKGSYDPNDLGLFTVSTLPLCMYLMRRGARGTDRMLGAGAMVVLLIGTVESGSRGGFLALMAVGVYGLFLLDAVRRSKRLAVTVLAGAALFGVAGDAYWTRMRTILAPQEDYNWAGQAESGRIEVWKRGLGYMARRPLLGVGVDQFNRAEGTMAPQAARQAMGIGFRWSAAHSSYVQIGAELGVFGLAAFIALLGLAFREARRIGRTATTRGDRLLGHAFGGLVAAYAVGGAFLSQAYATYLYFGVALLIGFSRVVACEAAPAAGAQMPSAFGYRASLGAPVRAAATGRSGRVR
jgi:hypothetical protein